MHAAVDGVNLIEVEVSHAVDLQLERQGGLQAPVDSVFGEAVPRAERIILGEVALWKSQDTAVMRRKDTISQKVAKSVSNSSVFVTVSM